ncbi:ABC transporter permease [Haliangium sp.]|uniref:ABC transporter permease n=1 Tax=Haliangium sp. TaxID=2663208 RepID=UPI003D14628F
MITGALVVARYTWRRMRRGRGWLVAAALALVPALAAALPGGDDEQWRRGLELLIRLVPLTAVILLADAVAEELESGTVTYLWTRPIPRAAVLVGKLVAAMPIVLGVGVVSLAGAYLAAHGGAAGVALGKLGPALGAVLTIGLSSSLIAIAVGALLPRVAFVIALVYLLLLDNVLAYVPNLGAISVAHHGRVMAALEQGSTLMAALSLLGLAAAWLVLGLWRLARAEYSR